MTDKDANLLSEKVSLISEKVAVMDERISNLNTKVECLDTKFSNQKETILEIHTAVIKNSVNSSWTKRIAVLMLSVIIGAVATFGVKSFFSSNEGIAQVAQKQEQVIKQDGSK